MIRCVIYTRYSSENQKASSLEDQKRECKDYADQKGWKVTKVYSDAAISGTSNNRPDYQAMLNDASERKFDVVLAESLDRFSRNLSDTSALHDQLTFNNIALYTKDYDHIGPLHVAMIGMMSQQFTANLADKVKRGQKGLVYNGKTAGGLGYGYLVGEPGERVIDETKSINIRRIFTDYANGVSPRSIAKALNDEGITGPTNDVWKDTTIRGQPHRGTGVLNNSAYIGKLIYGRTEYKKNPRTGKRTARPQPEDTWITKEVPELRIIDDELWEAVKKQQKINSITMPRDNEGKALNSKRRSKHVFSGLLRCGECGGPLVITAKGRYGCSSYRASRTCSNKRTIPRIDVEERVLSGLKEQLLEPSLVEEYIRVAEQEFREGAKHRGERSRLLEQRSSDVKRQLDRLVDNIANGNASATINQKINALEIEQKQIDVELTTIPEQPSVIPITNISKIYAERVGKLIDGLTDPSLKHQAIEIIQSMIEYITITPTVDGFAIDLNGELGQVLDIVSKNEKTANINVNGSLKVVAGVGFEPTTFRL